MFNDLSELFKEIDFRRAEIDRLQKIVDSKEFKNIQIHFFADGKYYTIYQKDTIFSLVNELKILLTETINQHEIDIQNLKLQF